MTPHGGARPNTGPKPKPPDQRRVPLQVRLNVAEETRARIIGRGNISAGIRRALEDHPMPEHPNEGAAKILRKLYRDVDSVESGEDNSELADALRMLYRDYQAWLDGSWDVDRQRAAEVIGEHAVVAKSRARDIDRPDIAAALTALEL